MKLRFPLVWFRTVPVLVVVMLGMAGSAAFTPAPAAAVQPATASGWGAEVNAARAAPRNPRPMLPSGALGRLTIDTIGVDAVARSVGVTSGGAMAAVPSPWDVGVYDQAVQPGQAGSAVIEGHLDWTTGPAVFWNLHRLGMGSEIDYSDADGRLHRFSVTQVRTLPWNANVPTDLLSRTGTPTITLITCSGTWLSSVHSYSTRLLLTATKITA